MGHNRAVRPAKQTFALSPNAKIWVALQDCVLLMFLALTPVLLIGCAGLVSGTPSTPPPTLDITNVSAISSTPFTTQVTWTTNVAADSVVDYGTTNSYGTSTPVDPSMVTAHQVPITGLAAATTYYYQVRSTDSKNNHGKSGGHSFKTQGLNISGTITPTAGGSGATLTLSGAASATVTANNSGAYTFAGLASGSYSITPSNTGYTFTPPSQSITLSATNVTGVNFSANTVTAAPTITTQPANQSVLAGQTATFSVVATGTAPLSYQWQKNGANITGATSSSYTTPGTTTSDSGSAFDVVISNSAGTVTSNAATLTVTAAAVTPTITTQPRNQTVTTGQTATFSVVATGTTPLTYKWQKNGANIAGATASSYTTAATTTADSGTKFDVVVSNSAGNVTSAAATLTVNTAAVGPTISTQPVNQTVTAGQTATFAVVATGAPLSYQWQKNGSDIAGAIGPSYTTPATTTADNNTTFDVIVSNAMGSVTSNLATLTINSATVCAPTGSGVCYYVSPTGADSNPGTSAAPFLTVQHAANVVNPGDMVIVRDGTYNNPALSGVGSKLIVMSRGGTATNHVVFVAEHKWGAKIDGSNNTTATGWEFSANYIDVKDFDCAGFSDSCMENYNGGSSSGGQFIDIAGNNIHDVGRYCTTTTTGRDGIFISNDNVIIEGNQIHDIGRYAPGESGCTNPAHYQNNDHGIYIDGGFTSANNLTIKNNIFYRIERGWSIQVYPAAVTNLRILNNSFVCGNPYRNGHITLAAPITNSAIENNISWQPTTGFLQYDNTSGYSNLSVANNLTYQGTVGAESAPAGVVLSGNLDNTDPMLVSAPGCTVDDPSVPNAFLQAGSPAIDAGLTLADVPLDYVSAPRPQGIRFDIGAFEYIF